MQISPEKSTHELLPLISEWKKRYSEALIEALQPQGNVLEVGFRNEHAANAIAKFNPTSHTIIESNPSFLPAAQAWARNHKNVTVVSDSWQKALSKLGTFDAIFFNDYPEESDADLLSYLSRQELNMTSQKAQALLNVLEEEFSKVKVNFTDQDIDSFFKQYGQTNGGQLVQFFNKLHQQGHITEKQYQYATQKARPSADNQKANQSSQASQPGQLLLFLRECLANHMKVGSRFSCVVNTPFSLYADNMFFEEIISNPRLNFKETLVPITLTNNPANINLRQAFVVLIEKVS